MTAIISCNCVIMYVYGLCMQVHGAGMMNTIFMSPSSVLFEIVPSAALDSRHMPMSGIFPRLAGTFGLHHYLHVANISSPFFVDEMVTVMIQFVLDVSSKAS